MAENGLSDEKMLHAFFNTKAEKVRVSTWMVCRRVDKLSQVLGFVDLRKAWPKAHRVGRDTPPGIAPVCLPKNRG